MGLGGYLLYPRERPGSHCIGPVWTDVENIASTGIRSPDRTARSESLYRLSYPGPLLTCVPKLIHIRSL